MPERAIGWTLFTSGSRFGPQLWTKSSPTISNRCPARRATPIWLGGGLPRGAAQAPAATGRCSAARSGRFCVRSGAGETCRHSPYVRCAAVMDRGRSLGRSGFARRKRQCRAAAYARHRRSLCVRTAFHGTGRAGRCAALVGSRCGGRRQLERWRARVVVPGAASGALEPRHGGALRALRQGAQCRFIATRCSGSGAA